MNKDFVTYILYVNDILLYLIYNLRRLTFANL